MGSKGPLPLGGSRAEPWPSFLHPTPQVRTAWPNPPPVSSAPLVAPSPPNGPEGVRPAASGTPSPRNQPAPPVPACRSPRPSPANWPSSTSPAPPSRRRGPPSASPNSTACSVAGWCRPRRCCWAAIRASASPPCCCRPPPASPAPGIGCCMSRARNRSNRCACAPAGLGLCRRGWNWPPPSTCATSPPAWTRRATPPWW